MSELPRQDGATGLASALSSLIGPPPFRPILPRRRSHGDESVPCALCGGYGDVVNPGNADPAVKVTDWLAPVGCPRCGQTGKDPNP